MLPLTVKSRCQLVLLPGVPETQIAAALLARGGDPERAEHLARLARGRPGWALAALADSDLVERQERWFDEWVALLEARTPARLAFAQSLESSSGKIELLLMRQSSYGSAGGVICC